MLRSRPRQRPLHPGERAREQRVVGPPVALECGAEHGVPARARSVDRRHTGPELEAARGCLHQIRHSNHPAAAPRREDGDARHSRRHGLPRIPRDDQAHPPPLELVRQPHDLAGAGHAVAAPTRVREQNGERRPARRDLAEHIVQGELAFAESEPAGALGGQEALRVGRNVADHGHRHPADLEHPPGDDPVGPPSAGGIGDVRGEQGVRSLAQALAQRVGGPVEIVLAQRGRGVSQASEQLHAGPAPGLVPEGRPSGRGAGVEAELGARAVLAQAVERAGERPGVRAEGAAKIAGGEDAEQHGVTRAPGNRRRRDAEQPADRALGNLGDDPPLGARVPGWVDRAPLAHRVQQQPGNPFAPVVDHGRAAQHRIAAGAGLPVPAEGHGEAVGRLHDAAADREALDPLAHRAAEIDLVPRAGDDVVVVPGHGVVEPDPPGRIDLEVARTPLQVGLELRAAQPHRAKGVVGRVERENVPHPDGVRVEPRAEIEDRRRGEIGAGRAALDRVHEIDQRVRPRAGRLRPHGRQREADRRARPGSHGVPCRREPSGEERKRHDVAGRDQIGPDPADAPAAVLPLEIHVHHRDARAERSGLDEVDAGDHRVAHLAVRVPHHDDVGTHPQPGQHGRRVLVSDAGRVVGCAAVHPRVHQRDGEIGVAAHRLEHSRRSRRDGRDPDPSGTRLTLPDHCAGRGEAGDADPHSLAPYHTVAREQCRVAGPGVDVGADVGKTRIRYGALQERESQIEIVVPRRGDVVAGQVHRLDHRMWGGGRHAREVGGERVTLEHVTRVGHDHLARITRPERVHHGRDAHQAAGERLVGQVVPIGGVPVQVRGGDQHDVRRILEWSGGEHERGEEGEHRREIWCRRGGAVM